ncbi:MAG: hypothetical protein IKQ15_03270 [Kiritimatiellae bacterium]|nr:hypothetical protein [Kiritimatiellia bacterium]
MEDWADMGWIFGGEIEGFRGERREIAKTKIPGNLENFTGFRGAKKWRT